MDLDHIVSKELRRRAPLLAATAWLMTLVIAGVACRHTAASDAQLRASDDVTLPMPKRAGGLAAALNRPTLRICYDAATIPLDSPAGQAWAQALRRGVLAWIEPLRGAASAPLASQVEIVDGRLGCADVQARFVLDEASAPVETVAAHLQRIAAASLPVITLNPTRASAIARGPSTNAASAYLLHEIGHAFGLADAFYDGIDSDGVRTTQCREAAAHAVMCDALATALSDDDRAAVATVFGGALPALVAHPETLPRLQPGRYRPLTKDLCPEWDVYPTYEGSVLKSIAVTYCGDRHLYLCVSNDACRMQASDYRIDSIRPQTFVFTLGERRFLLAWSATL